MVKAAFFPLQNSGDEEDLVYKEYQSCSGLFPCVFNNKGSIGKRYAKQDVIGTPWCFTFPKGWSKTNKITVRHIATRQQEDINVSDILKFLHENINMS